MGYYALTGRLPYRGDSEFEMLALQTDGAPFSPPVELRPDTPRALNDVIVASLRRDPKQRPTAVEFAKQVAAGIPNGRSHLTALAPNIAVHRGPSAVFAATLSSDVPTALSQLGAATASIAGQHRARRALVAVALIGPVLGSLATIAAFKLGGQEPDTIERSDVAAHVDDATTAVARTPDATLADAGVSETIAVDAAPLDAGSAEVPPDAPPSRLDKVPEKAVRPKGRLVVHVSPFADVYLDGRAIGTTPIEISVPAGKHRVRLVNEPRQMEETLTITIDPTKPVTIEKTW